MRTKVNKNKEKKTGLVILRAAGVVAIFLMLLFALLWIPAVQTYLGSKLTQRLHEKYGLDITVDKIRLSPTGKIVFRNILVRDHHRDTLIYARGIKSQWLNPWKAGKNKFVFGHTVIEDGYLNMVQYKGEKRDNLDLWMRKIDSLTASEKSGGESHTFLKINTTELVRFRYRLTNRNLHSDPLYLIRDFNGTVKPFISEGSLISMKLRDARFTDIYRIDYKKFDVDFTYTSDSMRFENFYMLTGHSRVKADITLRYTREQFKHFFDEVEWQGPIDIRAGGADLQKIISSYTFNPADTVYLQGQLGGVLNEWEINKANWHTAGGMRFRGDMIVFELMHPDSLGVQLFAKQLDLSYDALHHFLPGVTERYIPGRLRKAGQIRSNGMFLYKPSLLETDMLTRTETGNIRHKLKIYSGMQPPTYHGTIRLDNFRAGTYLDQKDIDNITGNFKINGKGFSQKDLKTYIEGDISEFRYRRYPYSAIRIKGQWTKGNFNGNLVMNDPHFKMDFKGMINTGAHTHLFSFTSKIRHADLYKTGWVTADSIARLQGTVTMNMKGNSWEDLTGTLHLKDIHYRYSTDSYDLKFLNLKAKETDEGQRRIDISSDKAVNGFLQGDFTLNRLDAIGAYALGTLLPRYKPKEPVNQNVRFSLFFDSNLLKLLMPGLENVTQTSLRGQIDTRNNYVHAVLTSDSLTYQNTTFSKARVILDNQNFIYNLYAQVDTIRSGQYHIYKFRTIHLNINDTVFVKTKATGGPAHRDSLDLAFYYHEKQKGLWEAGLLPSYLSYYHTHWEADPRKFEEKLWYNLSRDSLLIKDITFTSGSKKISFNGFNTPALRHIEADIRNLDLRDLGPVIDPFTWQGRVNGRVVFGRKEKSVFYNGRFAVDGFRLNDVPLGQWEGDFQTLQNRVMFIRTKGLRDDRQIFSASGYLDTQKHDMDINAVVNDFPVTFLNPFMEDIFDRIRGRVTGHFRMRGNMNEPVYEGGLSLFGVGMRLKELNTDYQFDDNTELIIKDDKFVFPGASFTDTKYGTRGHLEGNIDFYQFKHWQFDLHIKGDNLLALYTPYSDESTYYGTAFVKGNASVTGDLNKIKIDAGLRSNPGTKLYIQLIDVETVGEDNFIRFYAKDEYRRKMKERSGRPERTYEGLELTMNLDITRDADIEIVMDPEFGSVLHAKGEGVIVMEINTLGKFNMWGTYQVKEGYYDFKYAGIIEKKFEVESGSTIVWSGDPYHAQLNIRAIYHIPAADVTPLLREAVNLNHKVPVDVIINLTGDLMKPKIDFQIRLPQANSLIRSQVEYALSDPDRRILQVLSLLYSKSFISEEILRFSNRAAVEGNLSERVLSVFNALLENDFFNVRLNYVPGQENPESNVKTDTQVGVEVTTKVNKRIYINGKVVMPVGRYTASSVAGDIEAVMWLTPEGTLQFRLYNKRTPIEYAGQQEGYTQGAGIRFHVDFDTFRELLQRLGFRVTVE